MEDCYYFLYSSCTKKKCSYRHSAAAKKNLILCKKWQQSKPCQPDCPFRHSDYHLKKDRKEIFCYWEEMEQGCQKEFCNFKHRDSAKDDWKQVKIRKLDEIKKQNSEIKETEKDLDREDSSIPTLSKDLQAELEMIDKLLEEEGIDFKPEQNKK